MSMEIRLKRANRIYYPGEMLTGVVVIKSKSSSEHKGVTISMSGGVQLQLSAKSVGLFDAFYNSLKPIQVLNQTALISKGGKLPAGSTEIPFEFELKPTEGQKKIYETYHGVFVNIQYEKKKKTFCCFNLLILILLSLFSFFFLLFFLF